ncbi:NAD(P)/FAD-dependent oxidoreductase [Woeseia oceani]|uniref:Ferredoxin reductase n=1 Tax=Woeseia oceani TaxID=1548547 RepID=A0A193LEX2_9GAMM|nr:FAD-dependent oxidoreductase [Woeseia oceani]ANO51006.1 ferredoxin reductase [Woeseia oceani]
MTTIVIVGGGHAAGQAAASLRQKGHDGRLLIVADEPYIPYQRPPLSKGYLSGKDELQHLYVRQAAFYEKQAIEVRTNAHVDEIDAAKKTLRIGQEQCAYDHLLLCTGARPRILQAPGSDLAGIHYLRTVADVDRIRSEMVTANRVCVVGGGYIGLEVAAVAIAAGKKVCVLEAGDRVLQRVASPELSRFYADMHKSHGVEIRTNCQVTGFAGDTGVREVQCGNDTIKTDLVIIGVGVVPNVELAEQAGLACDNGIVVDERCRTSSPDIYAAGDCTNHPNPQLGRRLRLESVPNAMDQARVAATNMLGGDDIHDSVPWFWSDQYDVKLQMVGFSADGDRQILRGDMAGHKFAIFHLRDDTVVAVDAINEPREFMAGKKLFGKRVDATRLADLDVETKSLLD